MGETKLETWPLAALAGVARGFAWAYLAMTPEMLGLERLISNPTLLQVPLPLGLVQLGPLPPLAPSSYTLCAVISAHRFSPYRLVSTPAVLAACMRLFPCADSVDRCPLRMDDVMRMETSQRTSVHSSCGEYMRDLARLQSRLTCGRAALHQALH